MCSALRRTTLIAFERPGDRPVVRQDLGVAEDGVQRRSQFVADANHVAALREVRLFRRFLLAFVSSALVACSAASVRRCASISSIRSVVCRSDSHCARRRLSAASTIIQAATAPQMMSAQNVIQDIAEINAACSGWPARAACSRRSRCSRRAPSAAGKPSDSHRSSRRRRPPVFWRDPPSNPLICAVRRCDDGCSDRRSGRPACSTGSRSGHRRPDKRPCPACRTRIRTHSMFGVASLAKVVPARGRDSGDRQSERPGSGVIEKAVKSPMNPASASACAPKRPVNAEIASTCGERHCAEADGIVFGR